MEQRVAVVILTLAQVFGAKAIFLGEGSDVSHRTLPLIDERRDHGRHSPQ
jgi:hypothetical protein